MKKNSALERIQSFSQSSAHENEALPRLQEPAGNIRRRLPSLRSHGQENRVPDLDSGIVDWRPSGHSHFRSEFRTPKIDFGKPAAGSGKYRRCRNREMELGTAGFGNIMEATFTIRNNAKFPIKDVELRCTHSAVSGTVIDSNERTIYEKWEPGETRTISKFNMGFIHDQAKSSGVTVRSFTVNGPAGPVKVR